jgi:hypothetical protein
MRKICAHFGCVLYFTRQLAATRYDLFVATRSP